jgi:Mn-dependent DtxR family transcriptional regulator
MSAPFAPSGRAVRPALPPAESFHIEHHVSPETLAAMERRLGKKKPKAARPVSPITWSYRHN